MARLHIIAAGPYDTIQDRGRFGWRCYGVSPSGPMDMTSFAYVQALADLSTQEPAIEIGLSLQTTPGFRVAALDDPLPLAVSGPDCQLFFDSPPRFRRPSVPVKGPAAFTLFPGETVGITVGSAGFAYLAVGGAYQGQAKLGSHATHTRTGLGALSPLANTILDYRLLDENPLEKGIRFYPSPFTKQDLDLVARPLGLLPGPQKDRFSRNACAALVDQCWQVTHRQDRMAWRLVPFKDGISTEEIPPPLPAQDGHGILSEATSKGTIQIPGDGCPLILMADHQPTGGYVKPAVVIERDLDRLVHARPGQNLRFYWLSYKQADEQSRIYQQRFWTLLAGGYHADDSTYLLTQNLAGSGYFAGDDENATG